MLQREQLTINETKDKIAYWQESPFTKSLETEALQTLQQVQQVQKEESVDGDLHKQWQKLEGSLLSLIATARYKRIQTIDSLIENWLQQALKLDPQNIQAKDLQGELMKTEIQQFFKEVSFPRIRETDNRPGKKKVAEDIERLAASLIERTSSLHDKVASTSDSLLKKEVEPLLIKGINQFEALQLATKAYIDSLTGTFYTSVHIQEINEVLKEINELKEEILRLLPEEEKEKSNSTALEELDKMIGLSEVKQKVRRLFYFLRYQKLRQKEGFHFHDDIGLHIILTGNPGTGKTTLARLFAKIYYELGFLENENVVEVNRSHLVGGYVGQTEEKTMGAINKALGGVLFIDEAYSLKREGQSGNDYGQTAIDTLVSAMTSSDYAGKFAVILAGYPEEMRQFIWANPGLRSRFPESNHIALEDYTNEELLSIAESVAEENDYLLSEDTKEVLKSRIDKERVDESFGNARTVKNIVLDAIYEKGAKLSKESKKPSIEDFTLLQKDDFITESEDEKKAALEELDELIGLHSIKKEIKKLQAFIKMQTVRKERQLPTMPVHLHAVFTGNAGTGKTTVAKLYSQLLKETGYLKRGHLVVASRADLVAGYSGQTALKTRKKVREALGGVLFIDEAYALTSTTQSDFGKEAIDTLVDEMTRHGENLVVIIAGYDNEMKKLLTSNAGIASRFQKYFYFPDYTAAELLTICENHARKFGYTFENEAKEYLLAEIEKRNPNGNGRFAINLIEETLQHQAIRVLENNDININELKKEDFQSVLQDTNEEDKSDNF
jgi:SpoVK/Ycf46/Vps4 family AAA+-type ATPase